jgi:predicted DNA-binding protein YlxM (UPF0122 family)
MRREEKLFTIIVGDLVSSRSISDRQQLPHKIRLILNSITRKFKKEFHASFVFTRGIDELSAVLKRPHLSYRICRLLNEGIAPHLFRFAVVRGRLDVAITSKDARKIDGPAFHIGAKMIQQAKKEDQIFRFNLGSKCEEINEWLNELANLLQILRSGWTDHQLQVVKLYERLGAQKVVAKELNITQQAVSDALRQAHWKELRRVEGLIERILGKYDTTSK